LRCATRVANNTKVTLSIHTGPADDRKWSLSFALSWHGMAFLFLLAWRRHFAAGDDPPLIRRRPETFWLRVIPIPYSFLIHSLFFGPMGAYGRLCRAQSREAPLVGCEEGHFTRAPPANSPTLVLPALGNYQGYVVGLLVRAEFIDIINNRSDQERRALLTMSSQ